MIRIITDSTSDITQDEGADLGITIVPLTVHFGSEAYIDGVDLTHQDFFEKLERTEKLPTTSQVPPGEFKPLFQTFVDDGDDVIGIFISSDLSGTYHSAEVARDIVASERVHIIDSRTATFALALLVREAIRMRDAGKPAAEIADAIRELVGRIRLFAVIDTLKYLRMGGRVSNTTAFVGGLLGITPIIAVKNGLVEPVGKARGMKPGFGFVAGELEADPFDPDYLFAFGHSNAPDALGEIVRLFTGRFDITDYFTSDIGITVGTHVGPGAAGIAYIART